MFSALPNHPKIVGPGSKTEQVDSSKAHLMMDMYVHALGGALEITTDCLKS